jgi:hypothetical protein
LQRQVVDEIASVLALTAMKSELIKAKHLERKTWRMSAIGFLAS